MTGGHSRAYELGIEGFGDAQYDEANALELCIRRCVYLFLQARKASGELGSLTMTQDWNGNTLHLSGAIRPRELAAEILESLRREVAEAHIRKD